MELDKEVLFYSIDITLDSITKITLSPNLPKPTFETIKEVLESLLGGHNISINRSTLFENADWIDGFKKRSTV